MTETIVISTLQPPDDTDYCPQYYKPLNDRDYCHQCIIQPPDDTDYCPQYLTNLLKTETIVISTLQPDDKDYGPQYIKPPNDLNA